MTTQSHEKPDVIREFCRSQGAPTACQLARLSVIGRRECIRQWIIKARSSEIQDQIDAIAKQLYEQRTNDDPLFYEAMSVEELEDRIANAKRHAQQRINEEIRYGAICIEEIDSSRPRVVYNQYHELCDREWQSIVEGEPSSRLIKEFLDLSWRERLGCILILAFFGIDGVVGIIGKPASNPLSRAIAYALICFGIFLAVVWLVSVVGRGWRDEVETK